MEDHGQIYYVYSMHPHGDEVHRRLTGKFALDENGQVHVLEDHAGMLDGWDKLPHEKVAKKIQALQDSMYTEVVNMDDISAGHRTDLIPQLPSDQPGAEAGTPTTYMYHRVGMGQPQQLKFENGGASLDGYHLSDIELGKMIENLRSQRASLTRLQDMADKTDINKFEVMYEGLSKADPELAGALGHVRNAVKTGQMHPDVLRTLTNHIFKDSMVPSMGNKKAYEDFIQRPRQGVHIRLDGNDFGDINKKYGFEQGNEAIKHMFGAVRSALDESVGRKNAKSFRIGGDEGHVMVPSHQHAARFVRSLKQKLEQIPPIGGTHGLSMSVGVGTDPANAEHALIQAKTAKKTSGYQMGQAKTHAYSAIPGLEGHLPTEPE